MFEELQNLTLMNSRDLAVNSIKEKMKLTNLGSGVMKRSRYMKMEETPINP